MYGTDNPCLAGEVTGDGVLKIQIGNLTDLYFMLVELEDVLTHVVDDVDDVHGVQLEFVRDSEFVLLLFVLRCALKTLNPVRRLACVVAGAKPRDNHCSLRTGRGPFERDGLRQPAANPCRCICERLPRDVPCQVAPFQNQPWKVWIHLFVSMTGSLSLSLCLSACLVRVSVCPAQSPCVTPGF